MVLTNSPSCFTYTFTEVDFPFTRKQLWSRILHIPAVELIRISSSYHNQTLVHKDRNKNVFLHHAQMYVQSYISTFLHRYTMIDILVSWTFSTKNSTYPSPNSSNHHHHYCCKHHRSRSAKLQERWSLERLKWWKPIGWFWGWKKKQLKFEPPFSHFFNEIMP